MRHLCLLILSVLSMAFCYGQEHQKAQLNDRGIIELPSDAQPNGYFVFEIADLKFDTDADAAAYFSSRSGDGFRFRPLALESKQAIIYIDGHNHPDWSPVNWNQHLKTEMSKKPILQKIK